MASVCNISFDDCKEHELWVYPSVLFESIIWIQKAKNPPLTRAITDNALVIDEEVEQVAFDGGSILHLILWEKNIR